jgi:hypothetical protein
VAERRQVHRVVGEEVLGRCLARIERRTRVDERDARLREQLAEHALRDLRLRIGRLAQLILERRERSRSAECRAPSSAAAIAAMSSADSATSSTWAIERQDRWRQSRVWVCSSRWRTHRYSFERERR